MDYLISHGIKCDPLYVGTRIMSCNIMSGKLYLKDFINYQGNQSLEKVSKAYKVDSVLKKGFFPYKLIQPEYYGLVLKRHPPALEDYEVDKMADPSKKKRFLQWHKEESKKFPVSSRGFNFARELLEYNYNDTLLLAASALKYIESCFEIEEKLAKSEGLPYYLPKQKRIMWEPEPLPNGVNEDEWDRVTCSKKGKKQKYYPSSIPYKMPIPLWDKRRRQDIPDEDVLAFEQQNNRTEEQIREERKQEQAREELHPPPIGPWEKGLWPTEEFYAEDASPPPPPADNRDDDEEPGIEKVYPTAIHPFSAECVTSSSYAKMLERKYVIGPEFLWKVERLPIIKDQHLQGFGKASFKELEYTSYLMKKNPNIKSFLNTGESLKIKCRGHDFEPDAYDPVTKVVYEFYGCYYHGCYDCIQNPRTVNSRSIDMAEVRGLDKERKKLLLENTEMVSKVEVMWECKWNKLAKENPEIKKHVEEFQAEKKLMRLDLRACFKGGLSECFAVYMNAESLRKWAKEKLGPEATPKDRAEAEAIIAYLIDFTSQVKIE